VCVCVFVCVIAIGQEMNPAPGLLKEPLCIRVCQKSQRGTILLLAAGLLPAKPWMVKGIRCGHAFAGIDSEQFPYEVLGVIGKKHC